MASDIDAVLICSSGSHAPQVLAAAAAGKHVLVEKPACITLREARAMIDACDAAGVVLMVAYPKRYEPSYAYAARRVKAMHDVRLIQINHLHPSNDLHMAEFSFHEPICRMRFWPACAQRTPRWLRRRWAWTIRRRSSCAPIRWSTAA